MAQPLRYGIIGAGMMAREHIRNLALIPGSLVTALADPDAASRAESAVTVSSLFASEPQTFTDHRALLSSGAVDALILSSPNDTHAAILANIFAAESKLPVLCEKPVCTQAAAMASLSLAAAAHPAPVWIGMEYRYMPPVAELIGAIRAGTTGPLQMLSIREHRFPFLHKVGDWNRFNQRTGGTLVEKCCHFFDLMRLILADEAVRVFASGAADANHRDEVYAGRVPDIIDNAFVIVDFKRGGRAALDLCMFADGAYFQEEIVATGPKARVAVYIPGVARFWQDGGQQRDAEIEISPRSPQAPERRKVPVDREILRAGDHHGSTYFQHLRFRAAVIEGAPIAVTMEDGLRAVRIGLAAEQSIRDKRVVEIG